MPILKFEMNASIWGLSAPSRADGRGWRFIYPIVVNDVKDQSPAHKAGLRVGDVITTLNGRPIECHKDLTSTIKFVDAVSQHILQKGGMCAVEVHRSGEHWVRKCQYCGGTDLEEHKAGEVVCTRCAGAQVLNMVIDTDVVAPDSQKGKMSLEALILRISEIAEAMKIVPTYVVQQGQGICRRLSRTQTKVY